MLHSVKIAHQPRQKYGLSKNCSYDNFLRRENQRRLTKTDKTKKKRFQKIENANLEAARTSEMRTEFCR